jgi:hypothetical protein
MRGTTCRRWAHRDMSALSAWGCRDRPGCAAVVACSPRRGCRDTWPAALRRAGPSWRCRRCCSAAGFGAIGCRWACGGVTGIRGIALPPQELHRPMTACAADSRSVRSTGTAQPAGPQLTMNHGVAVERLTGQQWPQIRHGQPPYSHVRTRHDADGAPESSWCGSPGRPRGQILRSSIL